MQTETVVNTRTGAGAGRTLQVIRAGYGAALLLAPGFAVRLATGRPSSRRTRSTARVLGARHLVQTALTAAAPQSSVFALGGQVDTLHAVSMVLLAVVSRSGRRLALTDALTEAAFAALGFSASIRAQPLQQTAPELGL